MVQHTHTAPRGRARGARENGRGERVCFSIDTCINTSRFLSDSPDAAINRILGRSARCAPDETAQASGRGAVGHDGADPACPSHRRVELALEAGPALVDGGEVGGLRELTVDRGVLRVACKGAPGVGACACSWS